MSVFIIILILLVVSFFMALFSMKDIGFASEIRRFIEKRKVKGAIVFFEDSVKHYSVNTKDAKD